LTSIEHDSGITQRKLAGNLGIALGLANSYLRRCARKGLVKISQVPLNRYAYYLTPQGFAEKSRLMAEYLAVSFDFFRRARADCTVLLQHCSASGWRRVALYGASDLSEIAVLSAGEAAIEVVCIIDLAEAGGRRAGLPVVATLAEAQAIAGAGGLDGIVVTDTRAPQDCFDRLRESAATHGLAPASIVAPKLLGISLAATSPMVDEEAT
jgi:DNA-binding MarR family transcriptional regulator